MSNLENNRTVWIFQGDPARYSIKEMLSDQKVTKSFHWKVSRYRSEINENNLGLIWLSGKQAGIYGVTEIISAPDYFSESDAERKYWLRDAEDRTELRAKMKLLVNLVKAPITKEQIKSKPELQNLSIIKNPRGTNFKVSHNEWLSIKELIAEHIK